MVTHKKPNFLEKKESKKRSLVYTIEQAAHAPMSNISFYYRSFCSPTGNNF